MGSPDWGGTLGSPDWGDTLGSPDWGGTLGSPECPWRILQAGDTFGWYIGITQYRQHLHNTYICIFARESRQCLNQQLPSAQTFIIVLHCVVCYDLIVMFPKIKNPSTLHRPLYWTHRKLFSHPLSLTRLNSPSIGLQWLAKFNHGQQTKQQQIFPLLFSFLFLYTYY